MGVHVQQARDQPLALKVQRLFGALARQVGIDGVDNTAGDRNIGLAGRGTGAVEDQRVLQQQGPPGRRSVHVQLLTQMVERVSQHPF